MLACYMLCAKGKQSMQAVLFQSNSVYCVCATSQLGAVLESLALSKCLLGVRLVLKGD